MKRKAIGNTGLEVTEICFGSWTLGDMMRERPFDTLISHNRFTLLNRQAREMFDYAHGASIAILNAAPYAGGVLAKGSVDMPKITYQDADAETLERVRRIEAVCSAHGVEPGAAALRFSLDDPRVTSTIAGISRPERVQQTMEWATTSIPEAAQLKFAKLPYLIDDPEAARLYQPG